MSGDTPTSIRFCEHEHYDLDLHTAPREAQRSSVISPYARRPQYMHNLWITMWRKGNTMLEHRETDAA